MAPGSVLLAGRALSGLAPTHAQRCADDFANRPPRPIFFACAISCKRDLVPASRWLFFFRDPVFQKMLKTAVVGLHLQRIYTRIVVVVNAGDFLWISRFFSKKSWVYLLYKAVNDSVLPCCQFWTNSRAVYKVTVVHNRYLWICRTLSTGGQFFSVADGFRTPGNDQAPATVPGVVRRRDGF